MKYQNCHHNFSIWERLRDSSPDYSAYQFTHIQWWHLMRRLILIFAISIELCNKSWADEECKFRSILIENFDNESIASAKIGPARWIAHTPWNGDFGEARFANPGPGSPFFVQNNILSITASKDLEGHWRSGLIAAADASGTGSGTTYGYFEARLKMPPGPGTWPAFWLAAMKPSEIASKEENVEVDVVEYYGKFTGSYQTAIHIWNGGKAQSRLQKVEVPDGLLVGSWHNYGVDISPQNIVFFFDGVEVARQSTPKQLNSPMYPIVNLALGSGWPIDRTPNPSVLEVQFVHVYGRGAGPIEGCHPGPPEGQGGGVTRSQ